MSEKLIIENLTKKFGKNEGVENINLSVKEHELLTLLGPSGCGKTTILRAIGGFNQIDSGRILLDGKEIQNLQPEKRPTGMVFQSYNLWPHMTVYENMAFGMQIRKCPKEQIKKEIKKMLELVRMEGSEKKYPNQLSGGQQQRTAIGRAIVKNPDILLCDEPTGALDYNTSKEILKLIETVNQKYGNTVIMVTHNDAIKDMADRVVKLRDGMIRKNYQNEHKIPAMDLDW